MSKKNNNNIKDNLMKASKRRVEIDPPESYTTDVLAELTDDELRNRLDSLFVTVKTYRDQDVDLSAWETEICYAQREAQIRAIRRRAHETYMESEDVVAYDMFTSSEDDYPDADLDNIEFINLVRRIEATRNRTVQFARSNNRVVTC